MDQLEMEHIIVKYLSDSATTEDLDKLSAWIIIDGNQELFDICVQAHLEIITNINHLNTAIIKEKLLQRINLEKKMKRFRSIIKRVNILEDKMIKNTCNNLKTNQYEQKLKK